MPRAGTVYLALRSACTYLNVAIVIGFPHSVGLDVTGSEHLFQPGVFPQHDRRARACWLLWRAGDLARHFVAQLPHVQEHLAALGLCILPFVVFDVYACPWGPLPVLSGLGAGGDGLGNAVFLAASCLGYRQTEDDDASDDVRKIA